MVVFEFEMPSKTNFETETLRNLIGYRKFKINFIARLQNGGCTGSAEVST